MVNEVFAKKYFPDQNPLGKRFRLGLANPKSVDLTIVGVTKDARYSSLKQAIPPVGPISPIFKRSRHGPPARCFFELRTAGNPHSFASTIRKVVHDAAPAVPVTNLMTQTERIDNTVTQERTFADLCTAFAVLALIIACVGLYGTMAYVVARRTNEIGIRIALGAERLRIILDGPARGADLSVGGSRRGSYLRLELARCHKIVPLGVKAADPSAILLAGGILVAALLLAGFIPAARASHRPADRHTA